MKTVSPFHLHRIRPRRRGPLRASTTIIAAVLSATALSAALPEPIVNLRFTEGGGVTAANIGTLAGQAGFAEANGYPQFTNMVPNGPFAPLNNTSSVDFGAIAAGQGGRAVDLTTDGSGTLGALSAFTLCGWLNARNLNEGWGGNRIAFALESPDGAGFDLVQLANGALRIGINQWPDGANGGGPSSSVKAIKADPQAGNSNWVFFAATYDSSLEAGNLKYFFGSPAMLASLDTAHSYKGGMDNGGVIEYSGALTIGNFGSVVGARTELGPNGGSRVFRGLIDEFRIYDRALDLAQVQQAQLNGALPPVPVSITKPPASLKVFLGQSATFRVQVSGSAPISYQWQRGGIDIPEATNDTYTVLSASTADNGALYRVKVSNSVTAALISDAATLTVVPDNGHKISLSFSDGGLTVTNLGNLEGNGVFATVDGFPTASAKIPVGSFAPTANTASVDFGGIAAGQGGRAIDLTNSFGNTLGSLTAFTVSGWLNCSDLNEGWGGNRITFALATPGGAGVDLVQTGTGALRIGINEWPDAGVGGPLSSEGKITADPATEAANWVFFAVTYDSAPPAGNISYYFGTPDQAAQLDLSADYAKGPALSTGPLTIGNFSAVASARNETGPGGGSRCFRGLIDEINVFNKALTLAEVQAAQNAPAYKPATVEPVAIRQDPQSQTLFAGQSATFRVNAGGTPPLSYQWWKKHVNAEAAISGATNQSYAVSGAAESDSGDQYWVVVSNAKNTVTSQRATLTVLAENNLKVSLSFSEGNGTTTANLGNLGGSAALVQAGDFPVFSTRVPAGAFASKANGSSMDFGTIANGEGGRAIDLTNTFDNTLGSLAAFTVTGWLNCSDLTEGWGGNRIAFALATPGGAGFDVVQTANGALRIGINEWPDAGSGGPFSSEGKITADAATEAANWVFFAVTYDSSLPSGNISYYFGTPDQEAQLDLSADYFKGPILQTGPLTIGNFNTVASARYDTGPGGGSRCFRGLMDEINVFNRVLTLKEIQTAQTAAPGIPVAPSPKLTAAIQGSEIVVKWEAAGSFKLQYRTDLGQGTWADEMTSPVSDGNVKTVRLPLAGGSRFYRLINR